MLGDQCETKFLCGVAQSLVPAGEVELLVGRERKGSTQVDGVVGAQRMVTGALGCFGKKRVVDGVAEDAAPDVLEIVECPIELGRGQAPALTHPGQSRRRLDMGDCGGANAVRLTVGAARLLGSRLIDQELDQCARIEVEAQRRPSETYSAALFPVPWSLAGFAGR